MPRKTIGKKLRFEVFKRDKFACQYCGGASPDVLLHVDHIEPVAGGGTNDIVNLVTACSDCNSGKGARRLDDNSTLEKSRAQLEALQERRDQLKLMLEWKRGLEDLHNQAARDLSDHFAALCGGSFRPSEQAVAHIAKLLKKYSADVLASAMSAAVARYDARPQIAMSELGVNAAFGAISECAFLEMRERELPGAGRLYYIRGILRNRMENDAGREDTILALRHLLELGYSADEIENRAKQVTSTKDFYRWIDGWRTAREEVLS